MKAWLQRVVRFPRRPVRKAAPRRPSLALESLEDRTLLAADLFEPNNTFGSAFYLGRGGNLSFSSLSISSRHDADWYSFRIERTATDANSLRIDFTNTAGNLDLQLYDSGHHLIGSSTTTNDFEQVSLSGLGAGTYYARVYGVNGATNSYTLRLTGPALTTGGDLYEPDDTPDTAFRLPVVTGSYHLDNMTVHSASDVDWYFVQTLNTGGAGDNLRINFTNSSGNLDMQLYAADGTTLLASSVSTTNDFEQISLNGVAAGSYYLKVYGVGGATNSYSLDASGPAAVAHDPYEPNNSAAAATNLGTVRGTVTRDGLSIDSATDEDWFRFKLAFPGTAANSARIDFDSTQGNLNLELYAAAGTTLVDSSTGTGDSEMISLSGLSADTDYYLRVYGYNGAINPSYSLNLVTPAPIASDAFEPNDTLATASGLGAVSGKSSFDQLSIGTPHGRGLVSLPAEQRRRRSQPRSPRRSR
jgi:hypothetical protein